MKLNRKGFTPRASVAAVRSALIAMALVPAAAYAADPSAAELTHPTSTIEVGAGYVNEGSYKFGEYNGLEHKGLYGIGNIDLRGGGSYDSNDVSRWRVTGTDLGLETRDLAAEYGQQGKFRVNFGYDELRRNRSDSYQTPYQGAGSNFLTLPANWIKPTVPQLNSNNNFRGLDSTAGGANFLNTATGLPAAPTAAQLATGAAARAADVPDFQNVNLYTKRHRYDGGFSFNITPQWEIKASASQEDKTGYKPQSTVSSQISEFAAVLPDPIDQSHGQYNLSLNFTGDHSFLQAAYYGSLFKNNVSSLTWADASDPTKFATMSSAPSNQFHQFSLTGGWNFSKTTKLVVDGSYARNTQNDSFLTAAQNSQLPLGVPTASLGGSVITEAFHAKLTAKPVKDLGVAVGYKYDDRDNQTSVNTYFFQDANENKSATSSSFNSFFGLPANTLGSNTNIYANRPYSKKTNDFTAEADYAVTKGQSIKGAYEYQQIERSCPGSWINCADAPKTKENSVRGEWRAKIGDDLSGRVGYTYSERRVNYDENAFLAVVPMANVVPGSPTVGATTSVYGYLQQTGLTGFGPQAGFPAVPLTGNAAIFSPNNAIVPQALYGSRNNINELVGMRRYNMADRNRDKLRSSIDWSPNDRTSLQAVFDYNKDDYSNSVYGLQNAKSWSADIDGSFAVTDDFSINAFYTYEDQRSATASDAAGSNSNAAFQGQAGNTIVSGGCFNTVLAKNSGAKMDPCLNWSTDMRDKVDTFGIGAKLKNLMAGRLDLMGQLVYSRARTDIGVSGGSYVNNPAAIAAPAPALAAGVPAVFFINAAPLPTVETNLFELRLAGKYVINKSSAVRAMYQYQHLETKDYAYEGMQFGSISSVMPTNEQAPSYNVHVFGVSYQYSFQ